MTIAAGYQSDFFSTAALREVYRHTRGIPRLINVLCDRSLLSGFGDGLRQIGAKQVREAAREIRGGARGKFRRWISAVAIAVTGIAFLSIAAWQLQKSESVATALPIEPNLPAVSEGPLETQDVTPYGEASPQFEENTSYGSRASTLTSDVGGDGLQ